MRDSSGRAEWSARLLQLAAVVGVVAVLAGCGGGDGAPGASFRGSGVVAGAAPSAPLAELAQAHLAREWILPLRGEWRVDTGDVVGDGDVEIILAGRSEIRILDGDGRAIDSIAVPAPAGTYGFIADANGDGKGDFVLGGADDSTARVRILDGKGRVLAAGTGGSLVNGYTRPHFALDGFIYFTAGSVLGSTPRVTGRFSIREESIEWLRRDGVLPLGLVYSPATDLIGVHNRGTGRDLPQAGRDALGAEGGAGAGDRENAATRPDDAEATGDAPASTPPGRSAALVLRPDGSAATYRTFGAPVVEGRRVDGAVSSVATYPVAITDGAAALTLAVVNRASALYGGRSRLELLDDAGAVLASYEGPQAAEATVSVIPERAGEDQVRSTAGDEPGAGARDSGDAAIAGAGTDAPFVTAVWSTTGGVDLLDRDLRLRRTCVLPGRHHKACLQYCGDLTGDGAAEIIVSDLNRLYVMSPALEILAETRFPREVKGVSVLAVDGDTRLLVQAGDLYFLRPEAASEAADRAVPNGGAQSAEPAGLQDSAPGASDRAAPGAAEGAGPAPALESARAPGLDMAGDRSLIESAELTPIARADVREGVTLLGIGDMTGDTSPELLLIDRATGTVTLATPQLHVLSTFTVPEAFGGYLLEDVDGDRKDDLVYVSSDDLFTAAAVNADGRILFRTPMFRATDTNLAPRASLDGRLFLRAVTGHMLRPRGIYALSLPEGSIEYFYPTAAFPTAVTRIDDAILISTYTPGNGHTLARGDGFIDRDDAMFVHAIRPDGAVHSMAGPATFGETGGRLTFFAMDSNGDGTDETYATPRRDPTYNPGATGIHRLSPDGEAFLVIDGPPDTRTDPFVASLHGRDWLILNYPKLSRLEVYSPDLELIDQMQTGGSAYMTAVELAGPPKEPGTREGAPPAPQLAVVTLTEGKLQVEAVGGTGSAAIGWPDLDVSRFMTWPDAGEAPSHILLTGAERLAVLAVGRTGEQAATRGADPAPDRPGENR
mgnify:FL=1